MPTPTHLLTSDWHCQPGAWASRPEIRGDSFYSLQQIVDYANQYDVHLVGAGDLFDVQAPDAETCFKVKATLQQLGRDLLFVEGQHELQPTVPWLYALLDVKRVSLHNYVLKSRGIEMVGLNWLPHEQLQQALAALPKADMLVTHQVWSDFMAPLAGSATLSQVPHVRLVYTGDYHRLKQADVTGATGQPLHALNTGSTCMQDIGELAEKQVALLYDDLSYQLLPLKTRPVGSVVLDSVEAVDNAIPTLENTLAAMATAEHPVQRQPLIRVYYPVGLVAAYRQLAEHFRGQAFFFPSETAEVKEATEAAIADEVPTATLLDCLAEECDEGSPEFGICRDLLDAANIKPVLNSLLPQ